MVKDQDTYTCIHRHMLHAASGNVCLQWGMATFVWDPHKSFDHTILAHHSIALPCKIYITTIARTWRTMLWLGTLPTLSPALYPCHWTASHARILSVKPFTNCR